MKPSCVEVYETFEIDDAPLEMPDATFRAHAVIRRRLAGPVAARVPSTWSGARPTDLETATRSTGP